jgi:hypothetical protein
MMQTAARVTMPLTATLQIGTAGHRMTPTVIMRTNTKMTGRAPTITAMATNTAKIKTPVGAAVSFLSRRFLP